MARLEEDLATDGHLERLHAALVDALRASRNPPFEQPVTVAEIYQDLVPYRLVRVELGFEMNADYEHTLLRLLAGESELARLEPREAAEELRDELDSPNPNVGLFRKFAGCDVWIARPAAALEGAAATPAGQWSGDADTWRAGDASAAADGAATAPPAYEPIAITQPDARAADAPAAGPDEAAPPAHAAAAEAPPDAAEPAGGDREAPLAAGEERNGDGRHSHVAAGPRVGRDTPLAEAADESEEPEYELVPVQRRTGSGPAAPHAECAFCAAALPLHRQPRFCPYCGSDQANRPCGTCGESVEPEWRFCVACGSAAEHG
jgi:hypothetical protein